MIKNILPYLLAMTGAISVVFQNSLCANALKNFAILPIVLIASVSGLLFALAFNIFTGELQTLFNPDFPWFKIVLSGFFGFLIVVCIPKSFTQLGASSALTIIVVTQLLLGILLDFSLGNRNLSALKIAGVLTCLFGSIMIVRG